MTSLTKGSSAPVAAVPARASRQVVLVAAGDSLLGIPLERCREILTARSYTPLPGSAPWVCGLLNLRGRLVTVCDVSGWLRLPAAAERPDHGVVVVDYAGKQIGLAVDGVVRILAVEARLDDDALYPVRLGGGEAGNDGGTRVFALLDPDRIVGAALG